ncbi:MAG: Rieske 2Fe-2S domain-containing protein [Pseudomonadota bacterium]
MAEQWKLICKVKDIAPLGVRMVQRGLAWQELPGVALLRGPGDRIVALLDRCPHKGGPLAQCMAPGADAPCALHAWSLDANSGCALAPQGAARSYAVRVEEGKIYLDLAELNAPASRAEAALAGAFSVARHVSAL